MHEERRVDKHCLAVIRLRDLRNLGRRIWLRDTALRLGQFRRWKCNKVIVVLWFTGEVYLQRKYPSCKTRNEPMLRAGDRELRGEGRVGRGQSVIASGCHIQTSTQPIRSLQALPA
jgi:phage FluMu protein Com